MLPTRWCIRFTSLREFDLPLVLGGHDFTDEYAHTDSDGSLLPKGTPALVALALLTFNGEGERKAGALPCLAGTFPCLARIYRLATTNNCNCWGNDSREIGTALSGGWLDQIIICLTQLDPERLVRRKVVWIASLLVERGSV